jgi:hypothetical protein
MLDFDPGWVPWLCASWAILSVLLLLDLRSDQTNGLPLIFLISLSGIHLPGGSLLLVDWYGYYPKNWTYTGLVYTTLFLFLFVSGGFTARFLSARNKAKETPKTMAELRSAGLFLFVIGFLSMALLRFVPALNAIPSVGTVISAFWYAAAAGICLYLYAYERMEKSVPAHIFILVLAFPLFTVVFLGFLGFGLVFVIALLCFFVSRRYVPLGALLLSPLVVYFGLSFFITYFDKRGAIREAAWADESQVESAVETSKIITEFEWFDPVDERHLRHLDMRLNQNFLVGAGVEAIAQGRADYLNGESMALGLVAWIPRAIWINKPTIAGSTDLVARTTGLDFAKDTSVGIGNVLEYYANFGTYGFAMGAFALGLALRFADRKAAVLLSEAKLFSWLTWYLMGYSLTNAGGQFSEAIGQIAAVWVAIFALRFVYQLLLAKSSKERLA